MKKNPLTPNDPRLTALACGEISDAGEILELRAEIENDPALRREFEEIEALQAALQKELRAEVFAAEKRLKTGGAKKIVPFKQKSTAAEPRRRGAGVGAVFQKQEQPASAGEKIIRFALTAGIGAAATAAIVLAVNFRDSATPRPQPQNAPAIASSGEIPIRLQNAPAKENSVAPAALFTPKPAPVLYAHSDTDALAELAAAMPVRVPGDGENVFEKTARAGNAPLLIAEGNSYYAKTLKRALAGGKIPERKFLRIDGLANALLPAKTRIGTPEIEIDIEVVPAPWSDGRWFARATIRAGANAIAGNGEIIGKNALAHIAFDPTVVAEWRMIGCEDGNAGTAAMTLPSELRAGNSCTTLFELVPAKNTQIAGNVGTAKIAYNLPDGTAREITRVVARPITGDIENAGDETRFAAAIVSFGLVLRDSQFKGDATLAMATKLAANVQNENKNLFDSLVADATALARQ